MEFDSSGHDDADAGDDLVGPDLDVGRAVGPPAGVEQLAAGERSADTIEPRRQFLEDEAAGCVRGGPDARRPLGSLGGDEPVVGDDGSTDGLAGVGEDASVDLAVGLGEGGAGPQRYWS